MDLDKSFGPPDQYGRRYSTKHAATFYPGDSQYTEFRKNSERWVRLGDGREMPYKKFFGGMLFGAIQSGISFDNLLY